jgi:ABC-type uncharacterized transport system substrate-binding protein
LISYGADLKWCTHRTAYYVDRILKGAKPSDLPIEFPTNIEMVINLKAAKALGITVPSSRSGRRGDRVAASFSATQNVRFWHKADIATVLNDVRYWG